MEYHQTIQLQPSEVRGFRAVEVTGSLQCEQKRAMPFTQILLLHDDLETLEYARHNINRFVINALMLKQPSASCAEKEVISRGFGFSGSRPVSLAMMADRERE